MSKINFLLFMHLRYNLDKGTIVCETFLSFSNGVTFESRNTIRAVCGN